MMHRRRLRAGAQLIGLLVAGVILSVSIAAIVSLFSFSFGMTQRNDDKSAAYNIAREEIEYIRSEGFSNTIITRASDGTITSKFRDGTRVTYYSADGVKLATSTGAHYSATLVVTSDRTDVQIDGTIRPAADSMRTVIVTVRELAGGTVVHTDGTVLVRSGV